MQIKFSEQDFLNAIKTSKTHAEAGKKLGYKHPRPTEGMYAKFLKMFNPDMSHFSLQSRSNQNKNGASLEQMYNKYKRAAKNRGYTFKLKLNDFENLALQLCHYCGGPGDSRIGRSNKYFCGIDRKDNNIGYTPNNCVPCCKKCNFMKGSFSYREFLTQIYKIAKFKWSSQ